MQTSIENDENELSFSLIRIIVFASNRFTGIWLDEFGKYLIEIQTKNPNATFSASRLLQQNKPSLYSMPIPSTNNHYAPTASLTDTIPHPFYSARFATAT